MKKNIFVVGMDDFNLARLQSLPNAANYTFHQLLSIDELQPADKDPRLVEHVLNQAEDQLRSFDGPVDAIIGYWDYPISTMVPYLCQKFGLPSASLRSVLTCEHKYWSRVVQREVIPEIVPRFQSVDPFDDDALSKIDIEFPFWIKPVKAHSSQLSFKIRNVDDFRTCIPIIRKGIGHFSQIFDTLIRECACGIPDEIARIGGRFCIAEQQIEGRQCTIEGFVYNGVAETFGVIDTIHNPGLPTFARYQYPSTLPADVQEYIIEASKKVMSHLGYNNATFNIEYFYDEQQSQIWLLEINTRVSQSHCNLFEKVDGMSNLGITLALGLGQYPSLKHRQGTYNCAAKFFMRRFEDEMVTQVPSAEEIRHIQEKFPETLVKIMAKSGKRFSDLPNQDPYSFHIGDIFLGADDETDLMNRYHECERILTFTFEK